jgi:phytoene dehydrogenase-like protein
LLDASYDAIVVGGGHHGLIIACYLQKAGLKTAIFERQAKLGGAVITDPGPIQGFIMNPIAQGAAFYSHPSYRDFNLAEKGLKFLFPNKSHSIIFDNDTCLVGYPANKVVDPGSGRTEYSEHNVQKTLNEIARFSPKDAETAQELLRRYRAKWQSALSKYRSSLPVPWGEKNELEKLCDNSKEGIDPVYQFMTCQQIAYDLFESEELKVFFMRSAMTSSGLNPQDVMGINWFLHTLGTILSWGPAAIPVGGVGKISEALQETFLEMGGEVFTNSEVARLVIQNDKATGIKLKNGNVIDAKQLVVSDLSAFQTICHLIGENYVSSKIFRRSSNIIYDRHLPVWVIFAINQLPKYKAACFNADCESQPKVFLAVRNAEYFATKYSAETILNGMPNRLSLFMHMDTIWDRTRTPDDKHIIAVEEFAPPARFLSPSQWEQYRIDFEKAIIEEWQKYAPNMTRDNVLAAHVITPYDVATKLINLHEGSVDAGALIVSQMDRFRPIPEMHDYTTPIKNVYICSASTHPGGGTGRLNSFLCFQMIAKDFGLLTHTI